MSILRVARWRSTGGMTEWLCTQEPWNPEVAIIFGATACYRRAKVGCSHYDDQSDNSTQHTGAVRPRTGFMRSLFFKSPVRAMAVCKCSICCQHFRVFSERALFVRGVMNPYFFVGPSKQREALVSCLDGLALLESHGASLLGEEDSTSPPRWLQTAARIS
jgi:hypothetical protein